MFRKWEVWEMSGSGKCLRNVQVRAGAALPAEQAVRQETGWGAQWGKGMRQEHGL